MFRSRGQQSPRLVKGRRDVAAQLSKKCCIRDAIKASIAEGYPEIFGMHIHQKKVKNDGGKDEWNDEWNPFKPEFYDKEGDRLGLKKPPAPPEKLEGE